MSTRVLLYKFRRARACRRLLLRLRPRERKRRGRSSCPWTATAFRNRLGPRERRAARVVLGAELGAGLARDRGPLERLAARQALGRLEAQEVPEAALRAGLVGAALGEELARE